MVKLSIIGGALIGLSLSTVAVAAESTVKNWAAPSARIYAQKLSDETMTAHADLLSVTFHGVPPGMNGVYTMFAGSFPERIGNPDDPDDIDVSKKGITIIDPRWHRTNDMSPKFVVLMPLRDAAGGNIGLVVYAFKVPVADDRYGRTLYLKALDLRDALAQQIPVYAALFAPAP
jgi:hypothetical protein